MINVNFDSVTEIVKHSYLVKPDLNFVFVSLVLLCVQVFNQSSGVMATYADQPPMMEDIARDFFDPEQADAVVFDLVVFLAVLETKLGFVKNKRTSFCKGMKAGTV